MNREAWLGRSITWSRALFDEAGVTLPECIDASCGWPAEQGLARKRPRVSDVWWNQAAGTWEIFISPTIGDGATVTAILVDALVHIATGRRHDAAFGRLARRVGLVGPKSDTRPGPEFLARIYGIIAELGPYPHAALAGEPQRRREQCRYVTVECPGCGSKWLGVMLWIRQGTPTCQCGTRLVARAVANEAA